MAQKNNTTVGGQAVIEGVMMRSQESVATAVRRTNGEIVVRAETFRSVTSRFPFLKLPVLRGAVLLIEMLVLGIRTLNLSAEIALEDIEAGSGAGAVRKNSSFSLAVTMVLALVVGITIFFVGPLYLTTHFFNIESHLFAFNFVTGAIRILLLVGYMAAMGLSKELQRVFQYHGAEHKAVFAYEAGAPLTAESAERFSRFHPRCGTSFLFIVMIVAIAFFSLMDGLVVSIAGAISLPIRLSTHLPLIPVLAGISYECIRVSSKHGSTFIGKLVVAPGLGLQRLTTREPDRSQIEVALAALKAAVRKEEAPPVAVKEANAVEAE